MDYKARECNVFDQHLLEAEGIVYLEELESDAAVKRFFPDGARNRARTENTKRPKIRSKQFEISSNNL